MTKYIHRTDLDLHLAKKKSAQSRKNSALAVFMSISVIFSGYFDFPYTQLWRLAILARSIFMNSHYAQKFTLDQSFLKKSLSEMEFRN